MPIIRTLVANVVVRSLGSGDGLQVPIGPETTRVRLVLGLDVEKIGCASVASHLMVLTYSVLVQVAKKWCEKLTHWEYRPSTIMGARVRSCITQGCRTNTSAHRSPVDNYVKCTFSMIVYAPRAAKHGTRIVIKSLWHGLDLSTVTVARCLATLSEQSPLRQNAKWTEVPLMRGASSYQVPKNPAQPMSHHPRPASSFLQVPRLYVTNLGER